MEHLIHAMTLLLVMIYLPHGQCGICDDYNTWIFVPSLSTDPQSQSRTFEEHTILHFNTLIEALSSPNLNNSCLVIGSDVNLARIALIQNVERLLIRSRTDNKYSVNCNEHNNTGIYFEESKNIVITNVIFKNCGGGGGGFGGDGHRNLTAAISFNKSVDILVQNVVIKSAFGYGIILFNSNNARINNGTYISDCNNFYQLDSRSSIQGGGLYIEISSFHDTTIKLESVFFFANNAPSGKGGAISLKYRRAKGNTFSCTDCNFDSNTAEQGGAVHVLFSKLASNNKMLFGENNLTNNRATKNGGVFHIVHENANKKNWVLLRNLHFNSNKAYLGGCLSLILDIKNSFSSYMNKNTRKSKFFCLNCKFINCQAMIGSAMYMQGVWAYFQDLTVNKSQTRDEDDRKGNGGVYALKSALHFYGATKFQKNNSTSLVLESSTLKMFDNVLFKRNNGYNGGAISLYGHSKIILTKNARVEFTRNYAKNKGGAIYLTKFNIASLTWISNHTKDNRIFRCFISFEEEGGQFGKVTFHRNTVRRTGFGSDIYITTLRNCRRENEANLKQTLVTWRNFNFTNKKQNRIVTGAIRFGKLQKWRNIYPGKLITPQIQLEDERGNLVQGEVSFNFSNFVFMEQDVALIVGKSLIVQFRLLGDENTNFNATIHTISGRYISKTLPSLHLKNCPFGMKLDKHSKCKCDHTNNRANGIAECNEGEIYMYHNQWVPISSTDSGLKPVAYSCPLGYCKPCNATNSINMFCNYERDAPCAKGRNQTSRLCSKCEQHKSATFGGLNNCRDCRETRGYIWVSLIVISFVSLFVILLVVLRLDIMSHHLGICIYFYQVLYFHYTPQMWSSSDKFHTFLSILIGSIKFSYTSKGFPVFCVFDGMNDLEKITYNNIIPVWMLSFWFILYRLSPYQEQYRFSKSKLLHAFTIIGLMVYTDLTRNCINLLNFLLIGQHTYPYAYAATLYGRAVHLPYFISALVVYISITLYIPVHFFVFAVKQMKCKIVREPNNASLEGKLLYFIRKERYWFLPYFFLSRTFTFMTKMLIADSPRQTTTVTLVSLVNFVVFTLASPYRDAKENWVESILLACLTVIGVLNLGLATMYEEDKVQMIRAVVNILSAAPLCVVLFTVFMAVAGRRCIKKRQEQRINVPVQVPYRLDYTVII